MLRYDPAQDAYAILGVAEDATREEIESAYRRAVLTWHPDKSPAPDASEQFHRVQTAGHALRDAVRRREYDRMRDLHLGPRKRPPGQRTGGSARAAAGAAGAGTADRPPVPMRPPPEWLRPRVRVYHDAVQIELEAAEPDTATVTGAHVLAALSLGAAVTTGELMLAALAVVLWSIGRVVAHPPHRGRQAWIRVAPGRRSAEYHTYDQRTYRYETRDVPFGRLNVAVVGRRGTFRIELRGLPHDAAPVLLRTRSYPEAVRRAREAGSWLELPLAA